MAKRYDTALAARLGQTLARYRQGSSLTQEQLAEYLGLDTATICRYETGATLPSLVTLESIAHVLHIRISDLLSENPPVYSDAIRHLLRCVEALSPEKLDIVADLADRLSKL